MLFILNKLLILKNLNSMDCKCPKQKKLTTIPDKNCEVNLRQIQRLAFQRVGNGFGINFNKSDILKLKSWVDRMKAENDTKIVVTPVISANPKIESGDAITNGGGDNSTFNGVEEIEGVNPSKFTAQFKGLEPAIEKAIKTLACETSLIVYFILQGGKICVMVIDEDNYTGFDSQSVFLSDRNNEGYGTKDTFNLSFNLPSGWSENLIILEPEFNPLTELKITGNVTPTP